MLLRNNLFLFLEVVELGLKGQNILILFFEVAVHFYQFFIESCYFLFQMLATNPQCLTLPPNFFDFLDIDSILALCPVLFPEKLKLVRNLNAFLLFLTELGPEGLILLVVEIDGLSYLLLGILLVAFIGVD